MSELNVCLCTEGESQLLQMTSGGGGDISLIFLVVGRSIAEEFGLGGNLFSSAFCQRNVYYHLGVATGRL